MSKNRGKMVMTQDPYTGKVNMYQRKSKFQKALENARFMAFDVRAKKKNGQPLSAEERAFHRGRYESMRQQAKSYAKNENFNDNNNILEYNKTF